MEQMFDLFCVAGASLDIILKVARLPLPDEKMVTEFVGRSAGGLVANTACAASRLGLHTGWTGFIGDDDSGKILLDSFDEFGVDTTRAAILLGQMGDLCVILLDESGERTILIANVIPEPPILNQKTLEMLGKSRIGYCLARPQQWFMSYSNALHAGGGLVAIDLENTSLVEGTELNDALKQTDILFTNISGLQLYSPGISVKEAASEVLNLGVQQVIVTLGSKGAAVYSKDGEFQSPGFKVKAVDTTGGGDCFHAAYLRALLDGKELDACLQFANAAAAIKVQHLGARGGLPTVNEVNLFLESHT